MTPTFRHPIGADLDLTFTSLLDDGVPVPDWASWTVALVLHHPSTGWVHVVPGVRAENDDGVSFSFHVDGEDQADWPAGGVYAEMQIIESVGGETRPLRTDSVRLMLAAPVPDPAPLALLAPGG